ncbi:glycosyltransferase family 2 protein [Albidovulum sediminicola]|uniref:Glycosyltransferase family 2 protein n=1 Tax=Albidovulum sediminicola TaxID=2984331 RepID=A0ABT2YWW7_9RHOB|nr:glycosyltransferase family 2 protein [Defluviimonas sp. WL0075]MCV2863355.1 glycosyltransferase family 2 protein [Defluviimonas sp. WL0075]
MTGDPLVGPPPASVIPASIIPVSIIVVSRHRPTELSFCLAAIRKQDHPNFELVVVADPATAAGIAVPGAKVVPFDEANISAARNAGLAQAAGEIVAFIDDDAVAEPRWLSRLTAPFEDPEVAATGGFVIGRNGISFQWKASAADRQGRSTPLEVDPAAVTVLAGSPGRAIRTEGTNCAFRRAILAERGGFDPAYRFYLDETDLNMRLAERGLKTAIVPRARVHHGFAASARRRADRTPTDLTEIGASQAVFLRRHAPMEEQAAALDRLRAEQAARAEKLRRRGRIDAAAKAHLLASLDRGIEAGLERPLSALAPVRAAPPAFRRLAGGSGAVRHLCGWSWQARRLRAAAPDAEGAGTTLLILFSPTTLFHRLRFTGTHWEQRGGLFGRSDRADPLFRFWTRKGRCAREASRLDF